MSKPHWQARPAVEARKLAVLADPQRRYQFMPDNQFVRRPNQRLRRLLAHQPVDLCGGIPRIEFGYRDEQGAVPAASCILNEDLPGDIF
jgi:hypothetical protein